jgi:diguanylate cyclase (GGDEF)-like protein/excisionase family DNA binding protein
MANRVGRADGSTWLRLGDAATLLGVSLNTLRRWSDSGKLVCYRSSGGHRRYKRRDVELLLDAQAAKSNASAHGPLTAPSWAQQRMTPEAHALRSALTVVARATAEGLGMSSCLIAAIEDGLRLTVLAQYSDSAARRYATPGETLALAEAPLAAAVAREGRRIVIADLADTTVVNAAQAALYRSYGDRAIVTQPLRTDDRIIGIMELVDSRLPRTFTGPNVAFTEFMARQASAVLANGQGDDVAGHPSRQAGATADTDRDPGLVVGEAAPPSPLSASGCPDLPSLGDTLQAIVQRTTQALSASGCELLALADDGHTLAVLAEHASDYPDKHRSGGESRRYSLDELPDVSALVRDRGLLYRQATGAGDRQCDSAATGWRAVNAAAGAGERAAEHAGERADVAGAATAADAANGSGVNAAAGAGGAVAGAEVAVAGASGAVADASATSTGSFLSAPVALGKQLLGVLRVYDRQVERVFTTDESNLVEGLAALAALALTSANTNQRLVARAAELDEVAAAALDLSRDTAVEGTLRTIVRHLVEAGHAQLSAVHRVDGQTVTTLVAWQHDRSILDGESSPWSLADCGPAAAAVGERRPQTVATLADARLDDESRAHFYAARGLVAGLWIPLIFGRDVVGLLELGAAVSTAPALADDVEMAVSIITTILATTDWGARLQRRNHDFALVIDAGLHDSAMLSTDDVLHSVARRLAHLTHSPVVDIYAVEGETLRALVSFDGGTFDTDWAGVRIPLLRYPCSKLAVETGHVAVAASLDDPILTPEGRYSLEKWGYQSQASIPLIARGHVIGLAELSDYVPRDFADDLDLILGLSQVAANALENAGLFEQIERRSVILRELVELGSLITEAHDTELLLRSVAGRLLAIVDGANCDIFRLENDTLRCLVSFDRSGYDERTTGNLLDLGNYPSTVAAIATRETLVLASPHDPRLSEHERRVFRDFGFASEICVPLVVNDEVYGLIDISDTRARDYGEYLDFLKTAARMLATALENTLLLDQLSHRTAVLKELVELGGLAAQTHDLDLLLTTVAQRLRTAIGVADCDIFTLQDDELRCLVSVDARGVDEAVAGRVLRMHDFPATAAAVATRELMIVSDSTDPRLTADERAAYAEFGFRSEFCIPLVAGDQVIGLIDIFDTQPRDYGEYVDFIKSVGQMIAGAIANATLYRELEEKNARLSLVNELSIEFSSSLDLDQVLLTTARRLCDIVDTPSCDIYTLTADDHLHCIVSVLNHEPDDLWRGRDLKIADWGVLGAAIETRRAVAIDNPSDRRLSAVEREFMHTYGEMSQLAMPLISKDRVIGVLELIETRRERRWTAAEMATATAICRSAALAIDNAELYANDKRMHLSNLKALSTALNAKDYYTLGHAARVSAYMVLLARELAWPAEVVRKVEETGYLHDVGKIGVSDRILLKSGRLTDREWDLMRQHPVFSADIIKPLFAPEYVGGVRHHHERYDGGGYPDGLAGEQIPEIARAMCVVDSYDAMSFDRPYKRALQYGEARAELQRCSGHQFEPRMVEAFLRVLDGMYERKRLATTVAEQAATVVDPAKHALLRDRADEQRPEYVELAAALRAIRDANPPTRYLTTRVRTGERYTFVVDPEEDEAKQSHIGDEVFADEELPARFAGVRHDTNVLYVDEFGAWVSGIAEITASDEVVAVVVADMAPPGAQEAELEGLRSDVTQAFASMLHSAAISMSRAQLEAITDEVTGLYNHRHLHERLADELERAAEQGSRVALLLCDVDEFKTFNDAYGHSAGDRALHDIARIIEGSARHVDMAARYSGEEFAVVLIDTDPEGAREVGERIRRGVRTAQLAPGSEPLTLSVGVAIYPDDAADKQELIDRAEAAMSVAKRQGHDHLVAFTAATATESPGGSAAGPAGRPT